MAFCPNCGAQVEDGVAFCPQCGTGLNGAAPMPPIDIYDHTMEFHPQDISDNKVYAMLCYLMGTIGIIIALLASAESPYLKFHIRQAVKISVTSMLTWIAAAVLRSFCSRRCLSSGSSASSRYAAEERLSPPLCAV